MSFFEKFGIVFGNKKNKYLPEGEFHMEAPVVGGITLAPTDASSYKTLATFDLNVESPKYVGAIPEATIKFYPLN